MIGKAGLVAAVVISAVASGRSVDMRALYDQMYPVSTLKRDALNLCHEADLTFVRAWREDRQACYSGMPHAIALALGFVHPSSVLAGLFSPFGGEPAGAGSLSADAGTAPLMTMPRQPPLTARPALERRAAVPCREPVAGLAQVPARAISGKAAADILSGHRGATALATVGIAPHGGAFAPRETPGNNLSLLDPTANADLGDLPAAAADTGCPARS